MPRPCDFDNFFDAMVNRHQMYYSGAFNVLETLSFEDIFSPYDGQSQYDYFEELHSQQLADDSTFEIFEGSIFQEIPVGEFHNSKALGIHEATEQFSDFSNITGESYGNAQHQNPFTYHRRQHSITSLKRKFEDDWGVETSTPSTSSNPVAGSDMISSGHQSDDEEFTVVQPPKKRVRTKQNDSFERPCSFSKLAVSFKANHEIAVSFNSEKVSSDFSSSSQTSNKIDIGNDDCFDEQLGNEGVSEEGSAVDSAVILPNDFEVERENGDNDDGTPDEDTDTEDGKPSSPVLASTIRALCRLKSSKVAKTPRHKVRVQVAGRKKAASWSDAEHDAIETLMKAERASEAAKCEKPKKDLTLFSAISQKLKAQYGIDRNVNAAKNYWNRFGRERSGFEERVGGDPNRPLVASAQKTKKMQRRIGGT